MRRDMKHSWWTAVREPDGSTSQRPEKEERPCLIYIHGGGFFGGDTLTVENQCKRFAELADAVVISIDYPLSPETKYPVAFHMCRETVSWVWEQATHLGIDRKKIGISGDSAGEPWR